jgi:hypothetical protein
MALLVPMLAQRAAKGSNLIDLLGDNGSSVPLAFGHCAVWLRDERIDNADHGVGEEKPSLLPHATPAYPCCAAERGLRQHLQARSAPAPAIHHHLAA